LEMFDNCGFQRSFQQRLFHEAFIRACIKHIYKDDFASCAARLMRENRWLDIKQEVMITTPRRFGKTFSVITSCVSSVHIHSSHRYTQQLVTFFCCCVRATGSTVCSSVRLLTTEV
jgi:hypothetical protein